MNKQNNELNFEEIMERIRESIKRKRQEFSNSPSQNDKPYAKESDIDLDDLRSNYDIYNIKFTSHRRILGWFIVSVKKILRKLLTPILTQQTNYNAVNIRIINSLRESLTAITEENLKRLEILKENIIQKLEEQSKKIETLETQTKEQSKKIETLETQTKEQSKKIETLETQTLQIFEEQYKRFEILESQGLQTLREQISRAECKLRRLLYFITEPKEETIDFQKKVPIQELECSFDYYGFTERFRGSEERVKEHQKVYLEYFRGKENILDIGCGRGEFLELLREAGLKGKGVDTDLDMVLKCKECGLDVEQKDGLDYLKSLTDGSLGGIFAGQVVEHMPTHKIIELIHLAYKKLTEGGIFVVETLNPESLLVHWRWFWMDLTHQRLVHPETLRFLFETVGFREIQCRYFSVGGPQRIPPLSIPGYELASFNSAIEDLNNLLNGGSDYAIIGKK